MRFVISLYIALSDIMLDWSLLINSILLEIADMLELAGELSSTFSFSFINDFSRD